MEFDVCPDLIQTKNPESTMITRIKVNPSKEKDFQKEYQVMNFEINMNNHSTVAYCDSVIEEIRSLDNVTKIEYGEEFQQDNLNLFTLIESILSRPYLKQIIFELFPPSKFIDLFLDDLNIEQEFPKNCNVEEITFKTCITPFRFLNKVLDALPNIKKVEIFNDNDFENLPVFLKNISGLKHLKSLTVAICTNTEDFDAHKFRYLRAISDCYKVIKNHFPINSEVVIADQSRDLCETLNLTNLIEKKRGENPKMWYSI